MTRCSIISTRYFSRYYEDADFIPKRRYSRRPDTYAVPYSGEEVMFHWATRGMHYIKTGQHFQDYRFKVDAMGGACDVHFKLTDADIPKDNTKGDRRWFFPLPDAIAWDETMRTLTVPFHYRLPTEKEVAEHGTNSKAQHSVLAAAEKAILGKTADAAPFLQSKLAEPAQDGETSYLLRRMGHFARRHSADYFIFPDLRAFLERELEFYIKDQMLHLDDLQGDLDARLRLIRVVRDIADRIIDFLDGIEQLQNRLFEKPKFVLATDWLLHIRHVPQPSWPEVLKNKEQIAAWRELFSTPAKVDKHFLKTHPTLVLDTRHFDAGFKRRLLEQLPFDSIEEATDGLLIHSENWQALNLLQHKYAGKVACIYIDPPYNTGSDEFIYKDRYQHASWMSMMEDRLRLAHRLQGDDGAIFVSCDDNEQSNLRRLLDRTYGKDSFIATVIWQKVYAPKNTAMYFSEDHDFILVHAHNSDKWRPELLPRSDEANARYSNSDNDPRGVWKSSDLTTRNPYSEGNYEVTSPSGKTFRNPIGSYWRVRKSKFEEMDRDNRIWWGPNGDNMPAQKRFLSEVKQGVIPQTLWKYDDVGHTQDAKKELLAMVNFARSEDVLNTVKPTSLIGRVMQIGTSRQRKDWVLDFFAGGGTTAHAVIRQNREDGVGRRFQIVEMGGYFDSMVFQRTARALYAPEWKEGRPREEPRFDDLVSGAGSLPEWVERSPRLVKILRLESYEDSLQNLVSREETRKVGGDTGLRYLFEKTGEGAATLLNVEQLERPFEYTLEVVGEDGPGEKPVDLVETANLLLGLDTVRYETWTAPDGREYLAVHAQKNGRDWLVLWRDLTDLDVEAERKYLEPKITGFDEVRINGDSAVPGIRSIDLDLARAMGAV